MVQTNSQFNAIVIILDIKYTDIAGIDKNIFRIRFDIYTSQLGVIITKHEEQKIREIIDSLLLLQELDKYLREQQITSVSSNKFTDNSFRFQISVVYTPYLLVFTIFLLFF